MDMYDIIESLLLEKGINKKQLAEKIQVPYPSVISAFQRHSKSFSVKHQTEILEALDTPLFEYFDKLYGEDYVKQLSKEAAFFNYLSDNYGSEAVKLIHSYSELNATGAAKALDYISDLTLIKQYTK